MKRNKFFLSLIALVLSITAFAQKVTVTGTVKDSSNGDSIPFAVVQIKDTTTGATANENGVFTISAPAQSTLVISALGYESKEITATQGNTRVFLNPDSQTLDATVVVGYGSTRKIGNQVGAVATVKGEVVKNAASQSPLDLLQGQVAGLNVMSTGGVAGDNSISMKIHGVGSLGSSSEPLFIVDGVQSNSTTVMNMNPNDIQNITVLKDASSTSIYGSLGANGVVYVTTKGGRFDEKASVTLHTQWGLSTLANRQFYEDMMSGSELKDFWMRSGIQTADEIKQNYTNLGHDADTKWYQYMQKINGLECQNDLTIEGGSKKTAYLISFSQFHQDGATIGNYYDRYTLRTNVQAHPTDWLKVGVNISGYLTKDQSNPNWGDSSGGANYTFGGLSYLLNPLYSAIDPATGKEYAESYPGLGLPNPRYYAEKRQGLYSKYGLNGSGFVEIEPYRNLIITSRIGTDSYVNDLDGRTLPSASFLNEGEAWRSLGTAYSTKNTITNTIEYGDTIGAHDFSVLIGQEGIGYKAKSHSLSSEGLTDDRLMNIENGPQETYEVSESSSAYSFLSFFAHGSYSYQEKYFVDGTFRFDASSRFGKNNRWAPFWAIGGMWKISHEEWLKNVSEINDLSLKVSYGTQGNANIGNYQHLGLVAASSTKYNDQMITILAQPSNESLTWEKQNLFTATVAGRFWNRFDAEVSFYNRVTKDMLMSVPQPYTTGFSSLMANVGSMSNTGVDITLGVDILKGKDYALEFNTTFNYNAEKITELFDGLNRWEIANTGVAYVVGKPVMYYSPIYAGVDPADGAPMWYLPGDDKDICTMDPNRTTKDYNEEKLTQNTGKQRHEPITGGFGLRGHWRGLSFNIDFAYYGGKYLINNDAYFYANPCKNSGENQHKSVSDFWTPYNTNARYPDWSKGYEMQIGDTHILEDASFLRLKNLTIGYALSKKALGTQKVVKGVQFTVTGRNLWTVTKYEGLDPEVDSNVTLGIPSNTLQVLGGVEIKF